MLLAAVVGFAATAMAVPSGESWGAELAVSGGDDVNVRLADGAVRLDQSPIRSNLGPSARNQGIAALAWGVNSSTSVQNFGP